MIFDVLTGVRAAELKRVKIDWFRPVDIGPTPYLLEFPAEATKNRKPRTVGISERAMAVVTARVQDGLVGDSGLVFSQSGFKNQRKRASRELLGKDAPRITLRDLRHTYGTLSLWKGQDAKATMEALGHSDLAMTNRYQHSTTQRIARAGADMDAVFEDQVGQESRTRKLEEKKDAETGQ